MSHICFIYGGAKYARHESFIRKENFVIGDIEDFKRFIKLNTLAGEDWSRVWKGRN